MKVVELRGKNRECLKDNTRQVEINPKQIYHGLVRRHKCIKRIPT
jgi:hypothetical protein